MAKFISIFTSYSHANNSTTKLTSHVKTYKHIPIKIHRIQSIIQLKVTINDMV